MDKFIPVCEPYLNGNELTYVTDVVKTGWISSVGKYMTESEQQFSECCGCEYGVAVCNGAVALHLALVALGIGEGDEVILPTYTMIASIFAIYYTGAKPAFVDVDKDSWNIDINEIEEKITERIKAIMPVYIYGRMCDMDATTKIARKHNLYIVEDAAEVHGAIYKGSKAGSFSDIAAFSFFANKNITTGEGGMVVINNENICKQAKYYKNVCPPTAGGRNYTHDSIGFNYRMSSLVAAIGLAQVEKADEYRALHIRNNGIYRGLLAKIPGLQMQALPEKDCLDVCWMNTMIIDSHLYRHTHDELIMYLRDKGIDTHLLFNGTHNQKAMKDYGYDRPGTYSVSDRLTADGFHSPSASNLQQADIEYICKRTLDFHLS